jgi:hypothetical protein
MNQEDSNIQEAQFFWWVFVSFVRSPPAAFGHGGIEHFASNPSGEDFMPDLHFPRGGTLKYWYVIPTGEFIIIRGITFKEKEI